MSKSENELDEFDQPEFDQASVTAAANWLHERSQIGTSNQNFHEEMIAEILSEFVEFDNLRGIISNNNNNNNNTSEYLTKLFLSLYLYILLTYLFINYLYSTNRFCHYFFNHT